MLKTGYTILSVGGSIIIPKTGFDVPFLTEFRKLILKEVKRGKKFILVAGGGSTCRTYQAAAKEVGVIEKNDLDELGIAVTVLNASFLKQLFKGYAHHEVVTNPTKKIKTTKPIIIAAGWKPGCSTDTDAVLMARTYGAKTIFNLSNVDYVYDSDPRTNPQAERIEQITWKDFRKIVGDTWDPGANVPFDPIASKMAEKIGLRVGFLKGDSLTEVSKALAETKFAGTTIC